MVGPRQFFNHSKFVTEQGEALEGFTMAYRTAGKPNPDKSNAILICPALNAGCDVVSPIENGGSGWWEMMVGPGRPIDTRKFFVVCPSNLGTPFGSSPFRSKQCERPDDFPQLTVLDWVRSQKCLMDHLLLPGFIAVVGGSLGGMQALTWSAAYPGLVSSCIAIASAPYLDFINLAFNHVARTAIALDRSSVRPVGEDGKAGDAGLRIARMLAHITYSSSSPTGWRRRIMSAPENAQSESEKIGSYLDNQADRFVKYFDPASYVMITNLLDSFNLEACFDRGPLVGTPHRVMPEYLLLAFSDDMRFPPSRSREIADIVVDRGRKVLYREIKGNRGHDGFLCANEEYLRTVRNYLESVYEAHTCVPA